MSYATTTEEILAVRAHVDRRRELIRRSDDLLATIEGLNLRQYGALKAWSNLEAVRLTHDLVAAINELLVAVGLSMRRLRTTTQALDAIWAAQARLFGTDEEEEERCDS